MASSLAAMSAFSASTPSHCPAPPSSSSSASSAPPLPSLRRRPSSFHGVSLQGLRSTLPVRRSMPSSYIRATAPVEESSAPDVSKQLQEVFEDLKVKYDALENKSTVWVYGGGALVAVWLSSTILGAVNSVPLVPKILELIGLGYTGWFVYRYLLFKSSRKQLAADVEELKLKITGVPRRDFMTEDDE